MKLALSSIAVVILLIQVANSVPVEQEQDAKNEPANAVLSRVRRFTCNLRKIEKYGETLHKGMCKSKCKLRGLKGGWCSEGKCNCKKKIEETTENVQI